MTTHTETPSEAPSEQTTPQEVEEPEGETQAQKEWNPEDLTLAQIASAKYQPLGGKG